MYLQYIFFYMTAVMFLQGQENGADKTQNGESNCHQSDLAHIEFTGSNPFLLFKEWHKEARGSHLVNPDALCLSTCSRYLLFDVLSEKAMTRLFVSLPN